MGKKQEINDGDICDSSLFMEAEEACKALGYKTTPSLLQFIQSGELEGWLSKNGRKWLFEVAQVEALRKKLFIKVTAENFEERQELANLSSAQIKARKSISKNSPTRKKSKSKKKAKKA